MTPEEFQKYKEAEKEHLRKLKELKKAVHTLEREKSIRSAFERVNAEPTDLLEKQKDLVDRLATETARHEARLDMALDSSSEEAHRREDDAAGLEEELRRDRARALVKQLKRELEGGDADDEGAVDPQDATVESENVDEGRKTTSETRQRPRSDRERGRGASGSSSTAPDPTSSRDDRPEKTIGKM